MEIQNSFTVNAPVDQVWNYMLDMQRVAPCMPGATLTEASGDSFKGKVQIKMGPVSLSMKGQGQITQRDDAAKRIVIQASGGEEKGKGQGQVAATTQLTSSGSGTQVSITQDITVSGAIAQYGRGMMQDVTNVLMKQFASCLEQSITGGGSAPTAAKPVSGFSVGAQAAKSSVKRLFGKKE